MELIPILAALGTMSTAGGLVAAFCLTLTFGSLLANFPLRAAGTNFGAGGNTCCIGYDTARGEFSYFATVVIFMPLAFPMANLPLPASAAVLSCLAALAVWWRFGTGVSHPGGPRPHRILREPQWADKTWPAPLGWRCEIAEESHDVTHKAVANGHTLTGEAAGRQIWHRTASSKAPTSKGKATTREGFNPARNPNPNDSLWRAQRIAEWTAAGGTVPDASWKPRSALDHVRKAMSWYSVLQADDGHWAGDYGGPHFLLPGLVVVWYVTGALDSFLDADQREAMSHYLRVHQQYAAMPQAGALA